MTDVPYHFYPRHPDHDHDQDHGDENGDTVTAKVVAMCVLFLASMTLGLLPLKLLHWFKWTTAPEENVFVKLLLCFGGGVLLCTTFLHVLPEVSENLEGLSDFPDIGLPFAEFLMCLGFFIIYFVEELAHMYIHKKEQDQQKDQMSSLQRMASVRRSAMSNNSGKKNSADLENQSNHLAHSHSHVGHSHVGHSHVGHSHVGHSHVGHSHVDHSHVGHSHVDHSHADPNHVILESSTLATIRGLLVVLALSVHELFEGLTVGLEDHAAHVWYMFGAVSAHKLVIAFCIGVELVASQLKTYLTVIYVFTFAVVSPMGIGIGILISEDDQEGSTAATASVILQGLASGTLLYVVFFEILREGRKNGLIQWLAVFVGFSVMLGITLINDHDH